MMVETMLESSQDFGMSNGALPQWKREVLQRRAARSRTGVAPPATSPPPPPPAPADDDEELRYGPGIVNRLKSRYLSLALRDAPRRRPSVLRRAASLEHLLEERPPPVPCARPTTHPRPPRPQSMAAPPVQPAPAQRRDSVKRARSVDALSRLESRQESRATFSSPPPPPPPPIATRPPQPQTRSARTPRRPTPLLRETERPPPDVVRSTLRKFESAPIRRTTPSGRVSAALRDLEGPRTSTPEPRDFAEGPPLSPRTPSPLPEVAPVVAPSPMVVSASASASASNGGMTVGLVSAPRSSPTIQDESLQDGTADGARPATGGSRPVSRAALEGIARAGSTVRYVFEAPRAGSHLPPLAATNQVLVGRARRIGVIRPMPARTSDTAEREQSLEDIDEKTPERLVSPAAPSSPPPVENDVPPPSRMERKEPPPAALVEPIPRTPPDVQRAATPPRSPPPPLIIERSPSPKIKSKSNTINGGTLTNGHSGLERTPEAKGAVSRMASAGIERAWSGSGEKKLVDAKEKTVTTVPWARTTTGDNSTARRPRVPPPSSTSVVFNFSNRKEVPDYIENDGIILRGSRRNRIKPGEPGVVVLRPEALVRSDSDSETETDGGPPSPCRVRFINDNVLINGKSSMPGKPNKDRVAKLKLQFDDSLTRTFEYPSEISLCEDSPSTPPPANDAAHSPQLAESAHHAPLAANTHIASAALSSYTPSKTVADSFQLGVTRHDNIDTKKNTTPSEEEECVLEEEGVDGAGAGAGAEGDARPCGADAARSWSEARTLTTDLLF
ncbi:unnamed protein product [Arctia plantaginis]|uniref:Uncharacterized protein n=1 Tax=Arctia plantaginis TaxID=874455 RepID=A0A8S1BH93_ARCPL|nr:unnamed protein product [Arctia plantaginis]